MTRRLAHKLESQWRSQDVLQSDEATFDEFLLSKWILSGLRKAGFIRPSPIQLRAIPVGLCGLDMVVQAKSGTGKTCVFSVLTLQFVKTSINTVQVLILAPTREIAVQSCDTVRCLGCDIPGLEVYAFIGGMSVREDLRKLARCHVAVGTLGRLLQLVKQGQLCLDGVRLLVLDEADQLLGEGFKDGLRELWAQLPEKIQVVATSATYPPEVARTLEQELLHEPVIVRLGDGTPTLLGVSQWYCVAEGTGEEAWFSRKLRALKFVLHHLRFSQCLVFLNSQARAQSLKEHLSHAGFAAQLLSGAQDQAQRLIALARLKAFRCRILVTTDLAARGIDAERVNLVVHFDVARDLETHLHRSGRAGRYGTAGQTVTLVTGRPELDQLQELCSPLGFDIKPLSELLRLDDANECKVNGDAAENVSKEVWTQSIEPSLDRVELPPTKHVCLTEDSLSQSTVAEVGCPQPVMTEDGQLQPVITESNILEPTITESGDLHPTMRESCWLQLTMNESGRLQSMVTADGLLRPTMGRPLTFQEALSGKKVIRPVQPILPWPPDPSLGEALAARIVEEKEAFCKAYNIVLRPGRTMRLATGQRSSDSSMAPAGLEASAGNRQGKTEVGEDSCMLQSDADTSMYQERQMENNIPRDAGEANAVFAPDTGVFQAQQEASGVALTSEALGAKQADVEEPVTFSPPLQLRSVDLECEPTIPRKPQGLSKEDATENSPSEHGGDTDITKAAGSKGHVGHCILQEPNNVLSGSQQQSSKQKEKSKTMSHHWCGRQLNPNIAAAELKHSGSEKMKERKNVSYQDQHRLKSTSSEEANGEDHAVPCVRRSRRPDQQPRSRNLLKSPRSPTPSVMTHFPLAGGQPPAVISLCYQCAQKCDNIRAACCREQHSAWTITGDMRFSSWPRMQASAALAMDWSQNWFRWHQWYIRKMLEANCWH